MDYEKLKQAIQHKHCWVCGDYLGIKMAFVIGPMCAVNRISGEPPSHLECAIFAATACPFLTKPQMARREDEFSKQYSDSYKENGGIARNPGVAMVWVTRSYKLVAGAAKHRYLFEIGKPLEVLCFCEGRKAEPWEVKRSVDTGLPLLREMAEEEGGDALKRLAQGEAEARKLLKIA